jgi:microcystin-dependent protein
MADARISQLPAATTLASSDIIPFSSISASETRKITAGNLGLALTTLGLSVGTSTPGTPYTGQLWVNTSTNPPKLFVYNGATFVEISFHPADIGTSAGSIATNPGSSAPTTNALGQLWLDTSQTPDELKVFDGSAFVRVDPQGITDTAAAAKYLQITTAASTYLALAGGTMTGNLTLAGAPSTNNMASNKKYVDDQIAAIPAVTDQTPAGTIIYSARTTAPAGYVKADGAAISRTTFATLFTAIGTTYGAGNGSTTFNVPDLRGEFLRGLDDGRGIDSGRALGSAQGDQNKQHNHSTSDSGHSHGFNKTMIKDGGNITVGGQPAPGQGTHLMGTTTSGTSSATTGISISNDGGTETRPRNIALLACIKT